MKTLSSDTDPETERLHIELIRNASIFRRVQLVNSLIKTTRHLSWQGICRRYPDETKEANIQRFISLLYGDDSLARRVTDLIIKRNG